MRIDGVRLRSLAFLLSVSVAVLPMMPAFAMAAVTGTVSGAVTAAATGKPIKGVKLRVLDMETSKVVAEVTTGDEGKAQIEELPLGLYQVSVVAPEGYVGTAGPLVLLSDENLSKELSFALETAPNAAPTTAQFMGSNTLLLLLGLGIIAGGVAFWQATKDGTG